MGLMTGERLESIERRIGALGGSGTDVPDGSIDTDELADAAVTPVKLATDAVTTVKLLDDAVDADKLADDVATGTHAAVVADVATTGGLPVLHRITVASGADADTDVTLDDKTRVLDVWAVLSGAGTTGSLITVKSTTTAITDAMDVSSGADKAIFRAGTIDNAAHEIAGAGILRVSVASTGADFPGAEVYVLGVKVA